MGGVFEPLSVVLARRYLLQQPLDEFFGVLHSCLPEAECFADLCPVVLGGTATMVVGLVLFGGDVNLACDVSYGILVNLFRSRKSSPTGEEPDQDGKAEASSTPLAR